MIIQELNTIEQVEDLFKKVHREHGLAAKQFKDQIIAQQKLSPGSLGAVLRWFSSKMRG